jgi:ABC-type dipeptide/oligopeptide/nickel transport system permease subunit
MAYWEGTRFDVAFSVGATLLNAVPYYVAAILMLWPLGYLWGLFPTRGTHPQGVDPGFTVDFLLGALHHAALPIISVVITGFGFIALSMRANSVQVLGEGYVRVANLRGLADRTIALQYVGRNAVLPLYTGFMIAIGFALGGTVVLEQIFQYRGLGLTFFRAVVSNDYPLMMAAFILLTTLVVVGLLVADLTYGLIDPRAAVDRGAGGGASVPVGTRIRGALRGLVSTPRRMLLRLLGGGRSKGAERGDEPAGAGTGTPFSVTADVRLSRRERFSRWADEYLIAPARIMWSDVRARFGLVILGVYLLMGTVGPRIVAPPKHDQGPDLVGPFQTIAHPLGTDRFGRDVLSRVLYGARISLGIGFVAVLIAITLGTVLGAGSGYLGGWADTVTMRSVDLLLSFPRLVLLITVVALFEPSIALVTVVLGLTGWMGTSRVVRGEVLSVREQPYVEAARALGYSDGRILFRHVLPNALGPVIVAATLGVGNTILAEAALSFLGLGVQPPTASWGNMVAAGRDVMLEAWWITLFPGLAIVLTVMSFNLVGDGLRDAMDPRHAAEGVT